MLEATRESKESLRPQERQGSRTNWISMKTIIFFILLMVAGFLLTSASTGLSGLRDVLFGSGVLLWIIGVFGAVYCVVRRLAGPKAAKLVVVALFLILLSELIFSKRNDEHHDEW